MHLSIIGVLILEHVHSVSRKKKSCKEILNYQMHLTNIASAQKQNFVTSIARLINVFGNSLHFPASTQSGSTVLTSGNTKWLLAFFASFSRLRIGAALHLIESKQKRNDTTLPAKPESTASVSDGNRWLKDIFFQHLHRMLFVWYLWFAAFKQICIYPLEFCFWHIQCGLVIFLIMFPPGCVPIWHLTVFE